MVVASESNHFLQEFLLLTDAEQQQTLVILLHSVLPYFSHDQFPNLRQGLCCEFAQQLLQSCQTKLLVPLVDHFCDAIRDQQEHVTRRVADALARITSTRNQTQRKLLHSQPSRITAAITIVQDRQMPCYLVFGLGRGVEVEHCEGGVHICLFDSRQHTICTFEQSDGLLMELEGC